MLRFYLFTILVFAIGAWAENAPGADRTRAQFRSWYPQYGFIFQKILQQNCTLEYQAYLYSTKGNSTIRWYDGGDAHTEFTEPVINCILNYTSQYILYQLQSTQIVLGLTPTILAILGASSDETSLLAVIGKRPLLVVLLASASPSVYTSRAFDYRNPREILKELEGRYHVNPNKGRRIIIVILQYLVVLAALANIATINWQLGTQTVCSIATELNYMPATWAILGIAIHGGGVILLRLRARRCNGPHQADEKPSLHLWLGNFRDELKTFIPYEFVIYDGLDPPKIYVKWFDESKMYIFGQWFHSIKTVAHIIFRTLIFSGMNFIGPRDAMQVLGRYMASILCYRILLMYELSVIRECYNAGLKEEAQKDEHDSCEHHVECHTCGGRKDIGEKAELIRECERSSETVMSVDANKSSVSNVRIHTC
jgi:hypothetical protein